MLNPRKTKLERNHLPWSRRSRTMLFSMFLLCAVAGALWLSAASSVRSNPSSRRADEAQTMGPFARINERARIARQGDPKAIQDLADEIFDVVGFPEIPARTQEEMKERIVRSEIEYRGGGKGAIPEKNVVKMINNLANKLDLPNYARVDGMVIRQERVKLLMRLPNLFSQTVNKEEKGKGGVGSALKTEMSPMEASFLAAILLQQKMNNPSYQVTPQEARNNLHKRQIERWQAFRKFKSSGQKGSLPREPRKEGVYTSEPGAKSIEMAQALSRAKTNMRLSDLFNLGHASLDDLGIAK